MATMKVIEIMSDSSESWEEATRQGIAKVSETVKNIQSAWVKDQSVQVRDGQVSSFRVTLKVTFRVAEGV